ncbi:MAG: TonB-dependent receptor, partial [Bacteroidota bacterium]|nr:TonB-dependent receptor [Bacteroidota bacterium]
MKKITPILILMILLIPQILWCGVTGKISGKIVDKKTGEALYGATVSLEGTKLGGVSDAEGAYYIINVPPGKYDLKVTYVGYKSVMEKNVVVNIDRTTKVDFQIESTDLQTGTVEVVAHAEGGIIRDLTTTSQQINADLIKQMPVESMMDVIALQAGVTKDGGGGIHLRGGRSSEVAYIVDGMPVTNPFGGSMNVTLENNAIQQLEVISGTYNAEYGRAMSGVINIVTKEGTPKFQGNVTAYSGDFLTTNKDLFLNIDKIDPFSQKYAEGSFSGPVPFLGSTSFFVSGKYTKEENWLYGKRLHNPSDTCNFSSSDPTQWVSQSTGDSAIVPMNSNEGYAFQGKLTSTLFEGLKASYSFSGSHNKNRGYNHSEKYNPDFTSYGQSKGFSHLFSFINTLSNSTVQELRLSYYQDRYHSSMYDDPFDPRYLLAINNNHQVPGGVFQVGGISTGFDFNQSITRAIKYDITSQVHKQHLVKLGAEFRTYSVQSEGFSVTREGPNGVSGPLKVDTVGSFGHSYYNKSPREFSAYIQDKIEIEDFIVNAGVRFDYFDANSYVPTDLTNPQNKRRP